MVGNIRLFFYFLVLLLQNYAEGYSRIDPLVDTKVGLIRGLRAADGDYSMFLGIPFGKVDEENPFGASTPYPPFESVFEAYDDSAICPQIEEINNTLVGTLDCLHLNIYVPNTASSKNRLPVLVWIYGGGFSYGFSGRTLYGPKYLVKNDVVVVTLNYRVGPYGFMCLDTPEVPGNQGLKDQVLALRWIKDNIQSFGGDVNQITVMGESAGSYSVGAHLISGHEKLFNRAILQSGTPLLRDLSTDADAAAPLRLAELLGFSTDDLSKALSFLAKTDPLLIIAASSQEDRSFLPCVEKEFENAEAFITDEPINLNIPKVKGMPVLIGFNADERIANYANQKPEYYETFNNIYQSLSTGFTFSEKELVEMENIVRHFYIGDEKIGYDVRLKLSNFDTDFIFIHPTERTINSYLDNGVDKIFYYMFSYLGDRNWVRRRYNVTIGGAAHADEIGYLFDISLWKEEPTPEDQLMIDRITTLWTNFVKYGNPTPDTTELLPTKWDPITSKDSPRHYMNIDSELTLGMRPYHERTAFWDMFYKINEKFQKGYENDKSMLKPGL